MTYMENYFRGFIGGVEDQLGANKINMINAKGKFTSAKKAIVRLEKEELDKILLKLYELGGCNAPDATEEKRI